MSLIDSDEFQNYLKKVKNIYKKTDDDSQSLTPSKSVTEVDNDDNDDNDEDDDEVSVVKIKATRKRRKPAAKKNMKKGGKARRTLSFLPSDEEPERTPPPGTGDLTPLPSSSEDDEETFAKSEAGEEEEIDVEVSAKKNKEDKNLEKKSARGQQTKK